MGKKTFRQLLFLLVVSVSASAAQERHGTAAGDTVSAGRIVLLDPGISLGRAVFLYPPSVGTDLSFGFSPVPFPGDPLSPGVSFMGGTLERRVDLISPLRLQRERESSLNSLQMMLGALETGAVGYMAYRHLKKYGLFR